jgi:hypothetical protein
MEGYQCSAWDMVEVGRVTAGAACGCCYKRSAEDCCQDCNSACLKSLFFLCDQDLILAWLSRQTARKHKAMGVIDHPKCDRIQMIRSVFFRLIALCSLTLICSSWIHVLLWPLRLQRPFLCGFISEINLHVSYITVGNAHLPALKDRTYSFLGRPGWVTT